MNTPEGWSSEHEFPLPDGSGKWIVRAYEFATGDLAYNEWVRIKESLVGDDAQGNFSAWRTMLPDGSVHLVVVCGRPEFLPEMAGEPYDLDYENACAFALRRARIGVDADGETFSHEDHYDEPHQIDPATGYVKRWYRQR